MRHLTFPSGWSFLIMALAVAILNRVAYDLPISAATSDQVFVASSAIACGGFFIASFGAFCLALLFVVDFMVNAPWTRPDNTERGRV